MTNPSSQTTEELAGNARMPMQPISAQQLLQHGAIGSAIGPDAYIETQSVGSDTDEVAYFSVGSIAAVLGAIATDPSRTSEGAVVMDALFHGSLAQVPPSYPNSSDAADQLAAAHDAMAELESRRALETRVALASLV